jgi:hypothetical protein
MVLCEGPRLDRQAICAGCGAIIDQSQRYVYLELMDEDGSLGKFEWTHAEFHNERCIATMIKAAYTALGYPGVDVALTR